MSVQKRKGTRRERLVIETLKAAGLDVRRAGNNLPSKDVELNVAGIPFAIEVKDRANLALHVTLGEVATRWASEIPAVVWHRTAKGDTGPRRPVGPTLVAMRLDDWATLMGMMQQLFRNALIGGEGEKQLEGNGEVQG